MEKNQFQGRSLCVINDLNLEERLYLFQKTRELKEDIENIKLGKLNCCTDKYKINDPDFGIYEFFLEPSTRTAHSFLNASEFHKIKLNSLTADHSSFTKNESYADSFNNLTGYTNNIFIVRSKLEGLCRWLEINGKEYAKRNNLCISPAFINGGDGKHEHPTQELLDEFTFLEDNNWKNESIHIALVGDLLHGRTVHSKVDGLKIFDNVKVDLIAPEELKMPISYIKRMEENNFQIRTFESIKEYISNSDLSNKWYFTRPQLERMGDDVLKKADMLREKITFREEWLNKVSENTKFYHPLPRNKEFPTIPVFLDNTPLNGWEKQSSNGMYTRIILLGLISGKIGQDYSGKINDEKEFIEDFITEIEPRHKIKDYKKGINPLDSGVCIDHICRGENTKDIWKYLSKVMSIMEFQEVGYVGVDKSEKENVYKGMIFLPNHPALEFKQLKKLGAISTCTYNLISDSKILKKIKLSMPPRIYGFDEISCKNESCISHPKYHENCTTEFHRKNDELVCMYCETPHKFKEIWK